MKIIEILLLVVIVLALIMKVMFVPGGDQVLMLSATALSALYFIGGLLVFNRIGLPAAFKGGLGKLKGYGIVTGLVAGVAVSIIMIGSLFKLLELVGADEMLLIGLFAVAVSLVLFIIRYFINRDAASVYAIIRTGVALAVGVFLLMVSTMTIIRWQFRHHPAYIKASQEYYENPGVDSLWEKRDLEWHRIIMPKDAFEQYERDYKGQNK